MLSSRDGIPPGLPHSFSATEKDYLLYEDIDYSEYWADPAQARQNALEQRLIRDLLPSRGARIIDVGCGYGRLTPCYADRFDQVVLYDGSMSLLRQAQATWKGRAIAVAGDVTRLPFKAAAFDQVLSVRVLQHVHDLQAAILSIRRVLAADGAFLFSYHNKRNARRVLMYAQSRRVGDPFCIESAEVSPTIISHHPKRFASILESHDFGPPDYRGAVVINSLARIAEKAGSTSPAGLAWARFAGRHQLAPWLIGQSSAIGGSALAPCRALEELFECPSCRGELSCDGDSYWCPSCARRYPVTDGVVDFRI